MLTTVAIALLVRPELAWACTVCGAAEDNANTFLASTLGLSLLPLFLIFGGVGLIWYYNQPQPAGVDQSS